jgi:superfamily II DNA or RNA helicase
MKLAEKILDKKSNSFKIIIYSPKNCTDEIKKFKGAVFYYQWQVDFTQDNIEKLKNLNFEYVDETIKIQIENVLYTNNYIIVKTDLKNRFLINKFFTYNKFIYSKYGNKIKKIEICHQDQFHIYIPIGLKSDFIAFVNQEFNFTDIRKKRKFKFTDEEIKNCLGYLTLYDNQIEAVKTLFNNTNGIIKSPTGSGKTEILISYLKLTKLKSLIIVNSIDLARQTYDRCLQADLDTGIVQGQNTNENHKVVIATIQSSHKLKNNYDCVIVDECHQISSDYIDLLSKEMFLYRFGFSATPLTKDKIKNITIKKFIGDIIYEVKSETLLNENKIAEPFINFINIDNSKFENIFDWSNLEKLCIINNSIRNNKIIELCQTLKGQKLILIKKISHGKILQKLLKNNNIKSEFLNGSNEKIERENILKKFEENNNDFVLIGSKILFTGINLQNIFNMIYAGGGNSYIEVIQSLGRALRNKTKSTVNIFDFYDNGNKILIKHSDNRLKYYKQEGFKNIKFI